MRTVIAPSEISIQLHAITLHSGKVLCVAANYTCTREWFRSDTRTMVSANYTVDRRKEIKRYKSRNNRFLRSARSRNTGRVCSYVSVPPSDCSSRGTAMKQVKTSEITGEKHVTVCKFMTPRQYVRKDQILVEVKRLISDHWFFFCVCVSHRKSVNYTSIYNKAHVKI